MRKQNLDESNTTTIIPNRLYFVCGLHIPGTGIDGVHETSQGAHFFSIDNILQYEPFFSDFGPLNLGHTFRFCTMLNNKLKDPRLANMKLYFYCSSRNQFRSNAAVLIGAYQVIYMGRSAADAYEPVRKFEPYMPFRDASMGICTYRLMPVHAIKAFSKAHKRKFFDFRTFNVDEYEYFECVENGDLNTLIPGKFIAFSGPHSTAVGPDGYPTLTPRHYVPIFNREKVKSIIRLNKKMYDRREFLEQGFEHHDMFFIDGTTPSQAIIERFLQICENTQGMLAVHCKAGLGRTGTLVGCYIMKHWRFTAAETTAWIRLCRPGSIIGPQQQFLKAMEPRMWKAGKKIRMARKAEAESKRQVSSAASSSTATTPSPSKVRSPTKSRSSRSPSYSSSASPSAGRALSFARASPNSTSASPHMHKYMQNSSNSNTPASSNSNTNTSTASSRVSNKFYSSPTLSPAYGPSSASPQSPDFTGFDNDDMISAGIAAARTSLVHRSSDMRESSTGNYSSSMVFDKLNLDEGMHAHVSAHVNVHGAPDDTGAPSGPAQPVHSISMRDRHGSNESYDSVSSSSRGSSFTNGVGLTGLTGMSGMSGMGIMGGMVGMNSMGMRKDGVSDDALEQAMKNEWGGNYQGSVLMNRKYEKRSQHPNGGNGVTAGNKDYDDSKFRKPPSRRVI